MMIYGEDRPVNCSKRMVQLQQNCDNQLVFFTVWMRSPRSADRLRCSAGLAETGVNIFTRYCDASPFIALNDKTLLLKSIHCLIGSQCRSSRSIYTTLPRLDTPPKRRAAVFLTDCKCWMSHNGSPAISELQQSRRHDTNACASVHRTMVIVIVARRAVALAESSTIDYVQDVLFEVKMTNLSTSFEIKLRFEINR